MRIARISAWHLHLPLAEPYRLAGGRLFESIDSTLVRIDTDEGVSGWGEGCPWGNTYLAAHGGGIRAALPLLGKTLLGQDPRALDHINRVMDAALPGHPEAKSPLDIACWDILGKVSGQPLWRLLGGAEAVPVPVNSSISTGTPDSMLEKIRRAAAKGYRTHSAKLGGSDPRADIARIDAISAGLPEGHLVTFDINRGWTPAVAIQVLNAVDSRDWVEQPCETLDQCSVVQRKVPQPILLDEVLVDEQTHLDAWKMGACQGVKVKPNRVGGLTKSRRIRDFCTTVGWPMHIEDVGGTAFADTVAIHLASSTRDSLRMASWLCHDHLATDPMAGQGARNREGSATPPSTPGIGMAPDPDILGEPVLVLEA